MAALLEVHNLKIGFRNGAAAALHEAVRGIDFNLSPNTITALVGESGSGKSVSAMSIVGLLPDNAVVGPESSILYQGRDLLQASRQTLRQLRGKDISVIFQDPMSSLNPVYPVGPQIAESLRIHTGMSRRQANARALELLSDVGISQPRARMNAYPHQLSGGQQQRVMIAMAIACEPKLLIADEPTTALDVTVQRQIIELLARLQQQQQLSVLFISHDLALVGEIASDVVVMRHGQVREAGPVAGIFQAPRDAYTRALLACRPRLDSQPQRLAAIDDIINNHLPGDTARQPRAAAKQPVLLEAVGLHKAYWLKEGLFRRKKLDAVKSADFSLHQGRTLGIVGESGSGKTTLGMMLARLTGPSAGRILFQGTDLTTLKPSALQNFRRRIQIIFQNPYASLNPRFTVGQILTEPMRIHGIGASESERTQMALGWLERVNLPAQSLGKYPHEFSGGQRQRIAIARCLTLQPEIIICDESVSALDVSVQATVLNLLLDLQDQFGLTYVFISHDLAVVKYMADDILVMRQGEIVEHGSCEKIYSDPRHPYTQQLLAAIPRGFRSDALQSAAM